MGGGVGGEFEACSLSLFAMDLYVDTGPCYLQCSVSALSFH